MITAKDLCRRDGCKTHKEWILRRSMLLKKKRLLDTPFTGEILKKSPIYAEVDWGRWIARCECGGVEYVCKEEKIFYCFSCGNNAQKGKGRKVIFPDEHKIERIEQILEEREVVKKVGTELLSRVLCSKPKIPGLSKTWYKDETLNDLKRQNTLAKAGIKTHGL